jgi:hypothetical protein
MTCRSDLCSQGRKTCPTPQACEIAEESEPFNWELLVIYLAAAVAFGAVMALSSGLTWAQMVAWMAI